MRKLSRNLAELCKWAAIVALAPLIAGWMFGVGAWLAPDKVFHTETRVVNVVCMKGGEGQMACEDEGGAR